MPKDPKKPEPTKGNPKPSQEAPAPFRFTDYASL